MPSRRSSGRWRGSRRGPTCPTSSRPPAGLASYYEGWLKATPDDVEAMARLGRTLANQGRAAEARVWFDRAVKLAPSRKELRLALVEQLVQDKKFAEAVAQYEAMSKSDP